jgi:hypothetical protein
LHMCVSIARWRLWKLCAGLQVQGDCAVRVNLLGAALWYKE